MEIQELLIRLTSIASALNEIKFQKVRGELTPEEAKAKCAELLKPLVKERYLEAAYEEWKREEPERSLEEIIGME